MLSLSRMPFVLLILMLFSSCFEKKKIIYIYKQWHLLPSVKTINIDKAKNLKQFQNQKDIYTRITKLVEQHRLGTLISEGCEGSINKDFELAHNGWSYQMLESVKASEDYADIMALIPLKVAVKYPELQVLCGDSESLIDQNSVALSDLKGYMGFYSRLLEYHDRDATFRRYSKALNPKLGNKSKAEIIQYAKLKARESLKHFLELIEQRNQKFVEAVEDSSSIKQAIIIGGLHVEELAQRLANHGHEVKVITPAGYNQDEEYMLRRLQKML